MANITDVKLPDNSQYDLKDNISGYAKKVSSPTTDDLAKLTATGDLADSGKKLSDLVLKSDVKDVLNSTSTTDPLSANMGHVLNENIEAIVDVYGAKNFIPYPYYSTSFSANGITFTDNGDGSITASGIASADTYFILSHQTLNNNIIKAGDYALNGCPNHSGIELLAAYYIGGSEIARAKDTGSGANLTVANDGKLYVHIQIKNTANLSTPVTFYPMIRDARITDPTFAPFAETNLQLTRKTSGLINRNFIDNPWFTVNQRGITSATIVNNTYYLDRWLATYATNAGTIEVVSGGVKLTPAASDYVYIKQRSEIFTSLYGKVITASVLLSDRTIKSGTIIRTSGETQDFIDESNIRIRIVSNNDFEVRVGTTTTIRAVKLEVGSVSTLANDVAPNYAFELAKCRASTADPSDTYANKGDLVNYEDLTSLYLTGSTNSTGSTITAGTFFYLNGSFCKAKTAIANGATFTLNTNFEVVSVGGEISSINDNLSKLEANQYDEAVDISSYTSSSNYYTAPSDGYAYLKNESGQAGTITLIGSTGTALGLIGGNVGFYLVYVKKGLRLVVGGSFANISFFKLKN